jgi:Arc/MetJ family transcription regulator
MPSEPEVVRNFVGANMAFLRDSLAEIRFFSGIGHSGGKPLGGSDPDICIRVSDRWPERLLWYEPAARVFHHVSEERTTWRYFARRCINEGASKALLTARVGARTGLSSEREYVRVTLPRAIRRSIQESVERRDAAPLGEAAAIVAGLGLTGAGYAAGLARNAFR